MAEWKYTMDGVGYPSLQKIADVVGRSTDWVQARLIIIGKMKFTRQELDAVQLKAGGARKYQLVVFEGFGPATFEQMATDPAMCADLGRRQNFFRYRWSRAGRPDVVTRDLFLEAKPRDPLAPTLPIKTRSCDQDTKYSDPRYLPNIPWGDLEHLSNERNTGAARADLVPYHHGSAVGNVCQARIALP